MRLIGLLTEAQVERGFLSPDTLRSLAKRANVPLHRLQQLVSFYPHFRTSTPPRIELAICRDMSCYLAGSEACSRTLHELHRDGVAVHEVSCIGRCDRAPVGLLNHEPISLANIDRVKERVNRAEEAPRFELPPARRWRCDPYGEDQYGAIRTLLVQHDRDRAIAAIKESGLRGMGGAGFPTGTKWELVRNQTRSPKYVICNADESEPGTFKDAKILADLPHLVLEGMMLAAFTIGAERGIVYLRHEYVPEKARLEAAIEKTRAEGLLGTDILGTGFDFEVEIFVSPGGYILGEETALLEALEDKRGEPRNKPPFPGTHGLHGQPTLINNVESFAMVPGILVNGPAWWKGQGRDGCPGLKFIAVSGHIEKPGVYEVPLGTNSPKVEKQRKMLTALLLSDHPVPYAKEKTTGDDLLDALGRKYELLRPNPHRPTPRTRPGRSQGHRPSGRPGARRQRQRDHRRTAPHRRRTPAGPQRPVHGGRRREPVQPHRQGTLRSTEGEGKAVQSRLDRRRPQAADHRQCHGPEQANVATLGRRHFYLTSNTVTTLGRRSAAKTRSQQRVPLLPEGNWSLSPLTRTTN